MSILRKPHISKTGKAILIFKRRAVANNSGYVEPAAKSGQNENRIPAKPIDFASSRAYSNK